MKPIIFAPLVALALAGGSAGAFLAVTSDGSVEEAVVAQPAADAPAPAAETPPETPTPATATPTPAPTEAPGGGGGGGDLQATVVPPPDKSTAPFPDDWATFTQIELAGFTFRYPNDWYVGPGNGTLSSWDPSTWDKPWFPPNGILLQIGVAPIDTAERRPAEATDAALGDLSAWEVVYAFDPATAGKARVHIVAADGDRYQVQLQAYFANQNPDETTFLQIVSSFRLTN